MSNAALVNFAGGETSPKSRGRFDIASYNSSCRKLVNFIAEVSGPARFRPGFRKVAKTDGAYIAPGSVRARLIPFQADDGQAYMLEFSPLRMYVYKNGAQVLNGDLGAVVLPETPYMVPTPYSAVDLEDLVFAQAEGSMCLTHYLYPPKSLVVGSNGLWTLANLAFTASPFVAGATLNITSITKSTSPVIGLSALPNPDVLYTLSGIGGMTTLNNEVVRFEITQKGASSVVRIIDRASGHYWDTSSMGAYTTGGVAVPAADAPRSGVLYENRRVFAGTSARPRTLFLSRSPLASTGVSRLSDFTGGTDVDHACFFSLAPVNGSVDYIAWAGGTSKYLLVGTFGGCFRVSGGGVDEPITPSSINVKQIDSYGCAPVAPALNGALAYFIQRGGGTLRGIQYSADSDDLVSADMCLNADQIGWSPLRRVVLQTAKPDVLWVIREDGILAGMTVQNGERVAGWHRHKIGGVNARVIDVAVLPRVDAPDQLYIVAERTVNGATVRTVEVMTDDVTFPDPEDFFTGEGNRAADEARYKAAVYRRQEQYTHLDASVSYDGSDRGTAAGATLTPAAVTGTTIGFTASADVFAAGDVGKEIWKKPDMLTGLGAGKAIITAYVSATHVHADITEDFDSTAAIAAGEWHFAVTALTGLSHLEGEKVAVVADGAVIADGQGPSNYEVITVTGGAITLPNPAAVVHVGLPYEGMLITHNLEVGGQTGPAQDKARNISRLGIRFLNSLGCEFGTSLYKTEKVEFNNSNDAAGRPSPVFSGIKTVHHSDTWLTDNGEKNVVIVQKLPLPCVVQFIDIQYTTGDEV